MNNNETDSYNATIFVKYILFISLALFVFNCKSKDAFKSGEVLPIPSYIVPLSTVGNAEWNTANGIISCQQGEGFFQTTEKFQYFEMYVDFKPEGDVNSGIFIGCEGRALSATDCYEVNIWDNHPDDRNRTGAIVTRVVPSVWINTKGEWNTYVVRSSPGEIRVFLNGLQTAYLEVSGPTPSSPIAFQKFGKGKISFRNFKIERLQ